MGGGMDYRALGRSGLKVSPICLGTMMFGGQTEDSEADAIVRSARDAGINIVDTADVYSDGRSEQVVGRSIAADRAWWCVATKVGARRGEDVNFRGLSRSAILRCAHDSLRRLGTGHIDIYYLHKIDASTPLAETVRALADLVRSGDIRYIGVSNYPAWKIAEICRLCDELGIDRPVVSQPCYNAVNRMPEAEHLPACAFYGLGVLAYSPLARGVLTGKYGQSGEPPPDSRAGRKDRRLMQTEWRPESLDIAAAIKARAEGRGIPASQFAVAWVLGNRLVTGVVAGPRTLAQWQDYLAALEVKLDGDDEAFIDALVRPGHPSTPGYTDPDMAVRGRLT